MKIGIAADHAGFKNKEALKLFLDEKGYEYEDFGAHSMDPEDDYSDIVMPLAVAISDQKVDKGIAICGSGVGVSIAANKFEGVRAALISEHYSAHQGVEHDDLNLLCMGGRVLGAALIEEITLAFLEAKFTDHGRFQRRLNKVKAIEEMNFKKL